MMKKVYSIVLLCIILVFTTACDDSHPFFIAVSFEEYDLNFVNCERALVVPFAIHDDISLNDISIMQINGENLSDVELDYEIYKNEEYKGYMRYDITFQFNGCINDTQYIEINNISLNINEDVYSFDPEITIANLFESESSSLEPLMEPLGIFKPAEGNPHNVQFSYTVKEDISLANLYYLTDIHHVEEIKVNNLNIEEVVGNSYFENEVLHIEIVFDDIDYTLDFGRLMIEYNVDSELKTYYSAYNVDSGEHSGNLIIREIDLKYS